MTTLHLIRDILGVGVALRDATGTPPGPMTTAGIVGDLLDALETMQAERDALTARVAALEGAAKNLDVAAVEILHKLTWSPSFPTDAQPAIDNDDIGALDGAVSVLRAALDEETPADA